MEGDDDAFNDFFGPGRVAFDGFSGFAVLCFSRLRRGGSGMWPLRWR